LLTLCILSTLGGCENQLKSHVRGNLKAGNDKLAMISAITQCLPYSGFPRTFNALNCINEIIPEKATN
jgi:4-carboxymuconolactone decarboxylase